MRDLRPEYYSDSKDQTATRLRDDQFEYHLETITSRNQTHDFELFCRKLCEKAICPDLRAPTGPEGGGYSKADTETLPVSEEIRERHYEGIANQGGEKWAFAISAKKRWTDKARRDVQGIVETGRGYDRIFFVTSQHARARDRARLEDELTQLHGVPVTIHDRTWIVDETIAKERADLAYNFLKVGETVSTPKLGPNDLLRKSQLEEIEREIHNLNDFAGMKIQLVSQALAAARLSRNLELSRDDTSSRFSRAIRLAEKYGTSRQKLEARYERIWTAFWWFDDFDFLLAEYKEFEECALQSDDAVDLEWLCNLFQLLVNSVIYGHVSAADAKLWERADRLEAKLENLANERGRPNNQLEARSAILLIHFNRAMLKNEHEQLPKIWRKYAKVVDDARGLGEFNFRTLIRIIDLSGELAGNDPDYNDLVEVCASAVAERESEGKAALMYLNRAKKLSFDDNFDMIRWLGKAAVGLFKQEYTDELADATFNLALAYRSAGLLWAARASCAVTMATLCIELERENDIPIETIRTSMLWARISLELGHLPDVLNNIQLLNGLLVNTSLSDKSKDRMDAQLRDFDLALGVFILNLDAGDLSHLDKLPDVLDSLGLRVAHIALLYALGHLGALRTNKSIPELESDEAVAEMMSQLKSQRISDNFDVPLILNEGGAQSLSSSILGMRIIVDFEGAELIPVAETILGSLEAFFATAIEQKVVPHVEEYRIALTASGDSKNPQVLTKPSQMTTQVVWPRQLDVGDSDRNHDVNEALSLLAVNVLGASCFTPNLEDLIKQLFGDEAVHYRISMVMACSNSYIRINSKSYAQLKDWDEISPRRFELMESRPTLAPKNMTKESGRAKQTDQTDFAIPRNHRKLSVRSVINSQTWDKAVWRGCAYLHNGPDLPPCMVLIFEDGDAGGKIFKQWRDRFGEKDDRDEIAVSIIRNVPGWDTHHYIVQIGSRLPDDDSIGESELVTMVTRSLEMTPASSENLERFLADYGRIGVYAIMPGTLPNGPDLQPNLDFSSTIEKRGLVVKDSVEIKDNDLESCALRVRGIDQAS